MEKQCSKNGSNKDHLHWKFTNNSDRGLDGMTKTNSFGFTNEFPTMEQSKKVELDSGLGGNFLNNKNIAQEMRDEILTNNSNWNAKSQLQAYTVNTDNTFGNNSKNQVNKSSHVKSRLPPKYEKIVTLEVNNVETPNEFMPNFRCNRFKVGLKPLIDIYQHFGKSAAESAEQVILANHLADKIMLSINEKYLLRQSSAYSHMVRHVAGILISQLKALKQNLTNLMQINYILGIECEGIENFEDHFNASTSISTHKAKQLEATADFFVDELIRNINKIATSSVAHDIEYDQGSLKRTKDLERSIKNNNIASIMRKIMNRNDEEILELDFYSF